MTSRSLKSVGYDPDCEELVVEFRTGRMYCYSGVPAAVHAWLMRIHDKGGFFNRAIRDHYPWRDVTDDGVREQDLEAELRRSLITQD